MPAKPLGSTRRAPVAAAVQPAAEPRRSDASGLRDEILAYGLDAERALTLANALEAEDLLLDAVDALVVANRLRPGAPIERRLVRLRRDAFRQLDHTFAPQAWPHFVLDSQPRPEGPLEIAASEFDHAALRTGVLHHGHLLVRGLVPAGRVARLRDAIDRAYAAQDAAAGAATSGASPWYDPLEGIPEGDLHRQVARTTLGVLAADSPRALFEFLETVHELGLDAMIAAYFGERPALSAKKCTLRRVDGQVRPAGWHQDGAFLGQGIRSINAWTALSRCGRDAPGLELIPLRLDRLAPRLEDGGPFHWTVPPEVITREFPGVSVWRPEFEPGDVLFFDHWSLHRTASSERKPETRYAIESWFFAPSVYPGDAPELLVV